MEATPCARNDAVTTTAALHDFCGSTTPKFLYSDNSGELVADEKALQWMDDFKVSHLSVVEHSRFLGIVSENDLLGLADDQDIIANNKDFVI